MIKRRAACIAVLFLLLSICISAPGDVLPWTVPGSPPRPAREEPAGTAPLKRLDRGRFAIIVDERIDGEPSARNVTRGVIARLLVTHGFRFTGKLRRARFIVRAHVDCRYVGAHSFEYKGKKIHLEHQYEATVAVTVEERDGGLTAAPAPPLQLAFRPFRNGRGEREEARVDIRRLVGTAIGRRLVREGGMADRAVVDLLRTTADPKSSGRLETLEAQLADLGSRSIPYLLDEMLEEAPRDGRSSGRGRGGGLRALAPNVRVADRVLAALFGEKPRLGPRHGADRIGAFRHWLRRWEVVQDIPQAYRLPPEEPDGTNEGAQRPGGPARAP